jgi:hypothetical protein
VKTEDWKSIETARALVIGHDPRLKNSDTIAQYALFADYFFKEVPSNTSEKRKYGLAKATFEHIKYLTFNKIKPETVYITNLCNESLPHAPKNRMVYIPMEKAMEGVRNINKILRENPSIEYLFPMSLQVNYWLQKLEFYTPNQEFLMSTEPHKKGLMNEPKYFQPKNNRTFLLICGNIYSQLDGNTKVLPILHSIQFPLNRNTLPSYGPAYEKIRNYFKNMPGLQTA